MICFPNVCCKLVFLNSLNKYRFSTCKPLLYTGLECYNFYVGRNWVLCTLNVICGEKAESAQNCHWIDDCHLSRRWRLRDVLRTIGWRRSWRHARRPSDPWPYETRTHRDGLFYIFFLNYPHLCTVGKNEMKSTPKNNWSQCQTKLNFKLPPWNISNLELTKKHRGLHQSLIRFCLNQMSFCGLLPSDFDRDRLTPSI